MNLMNKRLNRDLLAGWSTIVLILAVTYTVEFFKGARTFSYVFTYILVIALPVIITWFIYLKSPGLRQLRYIITIGYFCMYLFSLTTGSTFLVFTYIFPLLSLIILYHEPKLVAFIGILTIIINGFNIAYRVSLGEITMENSKEAEIQIALIILCFGGCYAAAKLYDAIVHKNEEYVEMIDEKNRKIQEMTLQTITTVANTIDAKDEYTKGHSQRVSAYASAIAQEMGWSEEEVNKIRYIALLHDLGKIGVPDNVLNKPGKLTEAEYELMKKHTIIGGDILKDTGMFDGIALGAMYHHERYDGKGYPKGLEGEEIPLIARIICVADAYDAMTSTRVYRRRLSDEVAKAEIEKCKGKQFDPHIADVFLKSLEEGKVAAITSEYDRNAEQIDAGHKLWQRVVDAQNETNAKERELDHLTAVYNKSTGEKKIAGCIQERHGCLMMVDIINMVDINKEHGVLVGDCCITKVADIVSQIVPHAIVARYDGAQFICFYEGIVDFMQAEEVAKAILYEIDEENSKDKTVPDILVAIGAALTSSEGTDYYKLLSCVDKALYHIKLNRRQGFYLYRNLKKEAHGITDNKVDLNNIVDVLKNISKPKGAMLVNFPEFERMYRFVADISDRNAKSFCVVMFSISVDIENPITVEQRDMVMDYVERAIVAVLRTTDVTTRYSSTQQLVILSNTGYSSIHKVIDRVLSEFYKIYAEGNVSLEYATEMFDVDRGENS